LIQQLDDFGSWALGQGPIFELTRRRYEAGMLVFPLPTDECYLQIVQLPKGLSTRVSFVLGIQELRWILRYNLVMFAPGDVNLPLPPEDWNKPHVTSDDIGLYYFRISQLDGVVSFVDLIHKFRPCDSSDPQDKVYAILGFGLENFSLSKRITESFYPDYGKSVQQVYIEAVWFLLRLYKNLKILSYIEDRSYTIVKGLPSWVPDFSVQLASTQLEVGNLSGWSAAGHLKWICVLPPTPSKKLLITGKLHDHIIETVSN
jgi:hypothetical protein